MGVRGVRARARVCERARERNCKGEGERGIDGRMDGWMHGWMGTEWGKERGRERESQRESERASERETCAVPRVYASTHVLATAHSPRTPEPGSSVDAAAAERGEPGSEGGASSARFAHAVAHAPA